MPPFIQPAGFILPNIQYADNAKISQKNWVIGKQVKAAKLGEMGGVMKFVEVFGKDIALPYTFTMFPNGFTLSVK